MGNLKSKQIIIVAVFVFFMLSLMLAAILASKKSTERRSRASGSPTSTPIPPTATPPPSPINSETTYIPLLALSNQIAYETLILRNWPSLYSGVTQWTDIMFANTSGNQGTLTISIYSAAAGGSYTNGQLMTTLTKTIPAHGWYNTYGDSNWLALPDNSNASGTQTVAWAKITSTVPVIAMSRLRLVTGGVWNSPPIQMNDTPVTAASTAPYQIAYTPLVVRNWPWGGTGQTQWTELYFSNPNSQQVTITIKVYSAYTGGSYTNGQLMTTFTKTIPANGWWVTYGDASWNLPDNYPNWSGNQTLAWAEITSTLPIVGGNQLTIRPQQ